MLTPSSTIHQPNLFGTDLLMQLDLNDPLLKLALTIFWHELDEAFSIHHTEATSNLIVGVVSHEPVKRAVCDRGYRGKCEEVTQQ